MVGSKLPRFQDAYTLRIQLRGAPQGRQAGPRPSWPSGAGTAGGAACSGRQRGLAGAAIAWQQSYTTHPCQLHTSMPSLPPSAPLAAAPGCDAKCTCPTLIRHHHRRHRRDEVRLERSVAAYFDSEGHLVAEPVRRDFQALLARFEAECSLIGKAD